MDGNTVPMNPLAIVECIVQAAVGVAPAVQAAEIRLRQRIGAIASGHEFAAVPVRVGNSALR